MDTIGAFEAKTLVPVADSADKLSHKEIVEGMRALRKRVKPGRISVRDMVNQGRRY
jgi:pyruvate/2-oxoglutarate dehydrogenase complex dihydrolipoamide acyltransferase (E2) component